MLDTSPNDMMLRRGEDAAPIFSPRSVWTAFVRYRLSIFLCFIAFVAAGILYVAVRSPAYTAHTQLLIYNAKLSFSRENALFAEWQLDPSLLETQIAILKSENLTLKVIERLGLVQNEESRSGTNLFAAFRRTRPESGTADSGIARNEALKSFQRNLSIQRVGLSYVVDIGFTAQNPEQAARVANEMARIYIEEQDAARTEAAQSASAWLRERIQDLGPSTRIVARASLPSDRSNLNALFIVGIAAASGLAFGVGSALLRELFDRRVGPEEAAAAIGAPCLGVIPKLKKSSKHRKGGQRSKGGAERQINDEPLLATVLDHPRTALWHALRDTKVALDEKVRRRSGRRIGVTSVAAGEGKTVVAANFARLIASTGKQVLLIDSNPQDPALTRAFAPDQPAGLIDLLDSGEALDGHVWLDEPTGMYFLPLGTEAALTRRLSIIWSDSITELLETMSRSYDYIVFDLPALAPAADVRLASHSLDCLLLVVDAERRTVDELRDAVASMGSSQDKLLGSLLNKVAR